MEGAEGGNDGVGEWGDQGGLNGQRPRQDQNRGS